MGYILAKIQKLQLRSHCHPSYAADCHILQNFDNLKIIKNYSHLNMMSKLAFKTSKSSESQILFYSSGLSFKWQKVINNNNSAYFYWNQMTWACDGHGSSREVSQLRCIAVDHSQGDLRVNPPPPRPPARCLIISDNMQRQVIRAKAWYFHFQVIHVIVVQ